MLHISQGGLGPWYHFQVYPILVDGASDSDGIALGKTIFEKGGL